MMLDTPTSDGSALNSTEHKDGGFKANDERHIGIFQKMERMMQTSPPRWTMVHLLQEILQHEGGLHRKSIGIYRQLLES
ncbi:hypothetical protein L484_023501 [Morus notabilis]|uniref:Uncharacterized protein n=1 Tax=Morus notabilis TaxID=981085 RepID=W9RDI3_9ROSA|nr:hypothetical protein L484_023501 [Morus notabilis]